VSNKLKFFFCQQCGNIAVLVNDSANPLMCCDRKMAEIVVHTAEEGMEKHLPEVTSFGDSGVSVQVGSVPHPMEEAHHISFVYVETENGGHYRYLNVGDEPKVSFGFWEERAIAVYAYCNLHGMWKTAL